jgi:hypothetical protein
MTAEDFRRLALGMTGAIEGAHMGHPDFRANGRIFATLHSGDRLGMVKLTPEEQREFVRIAPDVFEPSSGAWGRQGCTNVRLPAADASTVRGAIALAWEAVVSKPRPRRRHAADVASSTASRRKRSWPSRRR